MSITMDLEEWVQFIDAIYLGFSWKPFLDRGFKGFFLFVTRLLFHFLNETSSY